MKKIILFSFVCISSHLMAQKSFFGVDAGINVANQRLVTDQQIIQGAHSSFFNDIVKPSFGVYYHLNFSNQLGARINAQYMGLGCYSNNGSGQSPQINVNYFSLPVSLIYFANKNLSFNVGSYVSFRLNGSTSGYHKNDFGLLLGAEHNIYKNFGLAVNYYVGLKNIILNDNNGTLKCTNRALQFILIYKFKKP